MSTGTSYLTSAIISLGRVAFVQELDLFSGQAYLAKSVSQHSDLEKGALLRKPFGGALCSCFDARGTQNHLASAKQLAPQLLAEE